MKVTLALIAVFILTASIEDSNRMDITVVDKRPNILFAISDDQYYSHTSFVGSKFINAPAFDRIAKEGLYFTHCYAGSPDCAPSRSAIVTGRHHWQNKQSGQHAFSWVKKYVPLTDVLQANGYRVGRTGKGVGPFQYAEKEVDSLLRKKNAAGIVHSDIRFSEDSYFEFGRFCKFRIPH